MIKESDVKISKVRPAYADYLIIRGYVESSEEVEVHVGTSVNVDFGTLKKQIDAAVVIVKENVIHKLYGEVIDAVYQLQNAVNKLSPTEEATFEVDKKLENLKRLLGI